MNHVTWNPINELEDVANQLNRVFGRAATRGWADCERVKVANWMPSVDICETGSSCQIIAAMSGMKHGEVEVSVQDGMLTTQGGRKQEEEKAKKFHRIERSFGGFMRGCCSPDDAAESAAKAKSKDGMLDTTRPESRESQAQGNHYLSVVKKTCRGVPCFISKERIKWQPVQLNGLTKQRALVL